MLVFCVGMYRACSTWQYGVAGRILDRHRDGRRLGFIDGGPFGSRMEPGLDPSAWYVLKAHDAHERYADLLDEGRALAISSHRDLRDVAFSWMHKTGATFEEIVDRGFFDACLRNDRFWRSQPRMLLQSYEALIADPARGIAEIADHLGVALEAGEADSIASALSFEANRKRTVELADRLVARGIPLSSQDQDSFDPASLLHWNHLRDGRAGGWRDLATPDQLAALDRLCGDWLIDRGYEADHAWAHAGGDRAPETAGPAPRVSYGRDAEDILVDRLFRGRKGTFVDIGAGHPTRDNNTYYFYLRGWRGVNVEPLASARDLFESRRRGDYNLALAVSDRKGELPFYEVEGAEGLSTTSSEVAAGLRAEGHRVVEQLVPTRTVAGLVEQYRLEAPDLCSIDVGGDEARVLRGIPLATWRPRVFVVDDRPAEGRQGHESWEPILLDHGYLFAASDGVNRFYLRDDLADRLPLFASPVNSLDAFERIEAVEHRDRADAIQRLRDQEGARAEEARAALDRELAGACEAADRLAASSARDRAELVAGFGLDRDAWQRERDSWQRERDAWQRERDAWQRERDSQQRQEDAWQRDRDGWQLERDAVHVERQAWAIRSAEVEARALDAEAEQDRLLAALAAEEDSSVRARVAYQAERERSEREQADWESVRLDLEARLAEARAPQEPGPPTGRARSLRDRLPAAWSASRGR